MIARLPVRVRRLAYRAAYVLLLVGSYVLRPHTRGVKCVVVRGDELLLVRHVYGPGHWDLPGGFCRRREPFADTARRELAEELAIVGARWTDLGGRFQRRHGRHDTVRILRAEVDAPAFTLDPGELAEARWFPVAAPPRERAELVDEALLLAGFSAAEEG